MNAEWKRGSKASAEQLPDIGSYIITVQNSVDFLPATTYEVICARLGFSARSLTARIMDE
jgi:hypothetical protein